MNGKNLLIVGGILLLSAPVRAQDAVVVQTNDDKGAIVQTNNGPTVTTVTKSKKQTTVITNAPDTGARMRVTAHTRPGQKATITTEDGGRQITVTVNNEPVTFTEASQPVMLSGRVMVPLRGVTEKLGGNVLYDEATKVITGAHPGTGNQFRLRVGSGEALLNGKQMVLDAAPEVINGTTYVPLRFVSEALGAKVSWQPEQRNVIITVAGNQATVTTQASPQ